MNIDPVILHAVLFLGALGLVFGLGLGFASKKFAVLVDPRANKIYDLLPGINCGACGYPGCGAYVDALLADKTEVGRCLAAKQDVNNKISRFLGREAKSFERNVAVILCSGGKYCEEKMDYRGIKNCAQASIVFNGSKACSQGCLTLGDCIKVCRFSAISQKTPESVPLIDLDKCTACGLCIKACPKNLIRLVPCKFDYHLLCQSQGKAADVKNICTVGCIGCGICVKACPQKDIIFNGSHAYMKYKDCTNCGLCAQKCPTKSIIKLKLQYIMRPL